MNTRPGYRLPVSLILLSILIGVCASVVAGERILFVSERDSNSEIYVMNPDGSSQLNLTANGARDREPALSPDGQKIAFTSNRDGKSAIYVMEWDGSNPTKLTEGVTDEYEPAWSPNGTKIAFIKSGTSGQTAEMYVMDFNGSNQVRLTTNSVSEGEPAWSPDGTKIAFRKAGGFCCNLWTINSDGTGETQLTSTDDGGARWSPDGTKLVFSSYRPRPGGRYDIYVMNLSDGSEVCLTCNGPGNNVSPSWSPDGTRIVFSSDRDGNNEVYVMNANGSNPIRLTTNTALDGQPSWGRFTDRLSIRCSEVEVCWPSATNKSYQVQYRSSVAGNEWVDLGSAVQGNGIKNCIKDAIPEGEGRRFYRVMPLP